MFGLNGGRIATGMLADCILVDLHDVRLVPGFNLVSDMVYSADGGCVDTTICDGRVLMQGGKVDALDEIIEQVRACVARLTGREAQGNQLLLIYTGNGKGKTSACVGQAVRALGQGFRVAFGQFMKRPDQAGSRRFSPSFWARVPGLWRGFYRDQADYPRHRAKVEELLGWIRTRLEDGLDMFVLDEALPMLWGPVCLRRKN